MYAIRSYYAALTATRRSGLAVLSQQQQPENNDLQIMQLVITSYSIHYTKLYEPENIRSQLHEMLRDKQITQQEILESINALIRNNFV